MQLLNQPTLIADQELAHVRSLGRLAARKAVRRFDAMDQPELQQELEGSVNGGGLSGRIFLLERRKQS